METRMLPVELTELEVQQRGTELARVCQEIDDHEIEEVQRKKQAKEALERLTDQRAELKRVVLTRVEYRETKIEERKDFGRGLMCTYRLDTGEEIGSRPLREYEMQTEAFGIAANDG